MISLVSILAISISKLLANYSANSYDKYSAGLRRLNSASVVLVAKYSEQILNS